jgi:hypothetical protein
MLVGFQFLAVLCCTVFAGAAIYISLVEHPARMGCDTKTAATVWAPSYKRATVMQAPLAALSFLAGIGVWLFGGGILWLIGAVLIGLVIPFTLSALCQRTINFSPLDAIYRRLKPDLCSISGGACTLCEARSVFWALSSIWFRYLGASKRRATSF